MSLESTFPNLASTTYALTSPPDVQYNCIAWAAGETDRWWWPDPFLQKFWPAGVVRDETINSFVAAFQSLGYVQCEDGAFLVDVEKIAIYGKGQPTHAARQLADGTWTSKLGQAWDISHANCDGVAGAVYGNVLLFMQRPRPHLSTS